MTLRFFLLLIALAAPVSAQVAGEPGDILDRAARSNWYLRVVTTAGDTVLGRIRYQAGDEYRLGDVRLLASDVMVIDRRMEDVSRIGLFMAGGGALLGLFGAAAAEGLAERDLGWTNTALFVGGGSLIGFFIGSSLVPGETRWEPFWRRL